jgi:hypothetical protein
MTAQPRQHRLLAELVGDRQGQAEEPRIAGDVEDRSRRIVPAELRRRPAEEPQRDLGPLRREIEGQ